jgi:1-acyl-sn-glycerol-3-phosphate acyltransferase
MFNRILAGLKGAVASILLAANVLLIALSMVPFALLKLLLPLPPVRKFTDHALNRLAEQWTVFNGWWIAAMQNIRWDVAGVDALHRRGWYLVSSNHQSWVDILVLQKVFLRRIPFLKFFLKRELIYVPVIGLAWWALDFPFMRRGKGSRSSKTDFAATRKACERFKLIPTSVINFLEGTRFSEAKKNKQRSPYRHLLKPRIGGLSIALGTMGEQFEAMLDVTIIYPQGVPTFWDLLSGKLREVVVRVEEIKIPAELLAGDYENDSAFRGQMQAWVQQMWDEKDRKIEAWLTNANKAPAR